MSRTPKAKKPTKKALPIQPWHEAIEVIQAKLLELDAAGSSGFEGVMRDLLTELTGQQFYLAKSGHQDGSDVRSLPSNFIRIGLEAKRYKAGTPLPVDQLKAKIIEAAHAIDPVDLWILAATREISVTDREALGEIADQNGMKVIVWDWPLYAASPPPIALMLSAATHIIPRGLMDAALDGALKTIAGLPDYLKWRDLIVSELCGADIGYVAAAKASMDWLGQSQQNKGAALAHLRGHHDLRNPDVKLVPRPTISDWLQNWWDHGPFSAALIGVEGIGKSWAALAWWNNLSDRGMTPLTVFISAKDVQSGDPEEAIAVALAKQTGRRETAFWRKRLANWKKAAPGLPILVMLDGLNQNFNKRDWSDFLQPIATEDQVSRYRVLMTCWPTWWKSLGALVQLHPVPAALEVGGFNDSELKENLRQHGFKDNKLGKDLTALLRVPRLFSLALQYRAELSESGDITAERLAYEDWKHRLKQGYVRQSWSDEEFKELIAELAKEFRTAFEAATVSAKDLMERVGASSGASNGDLAITVQDLISGQWLESAGAPHRYRIRQDMAPYALGLALASELKSVIKKEEASAIIAEFVDPYRGQQLMVSILRSAVTAALIDPNITREARTALVVRWLHEQNFSGHDFEAWWRVMGLDIELFLNLAEDHWLYPERSGGSAEDEVLIKGFANACQFPVVASAISAMTAKWLGWAWEDPDEGRFLGKTDRDTERSIANRKNTIHNFSLWSARQDKSEWPVVELRTEGNVSWLAHRAAGLLSFTPRALQRNAFEAWALSRSIMTIARHFDELAWVLRFNKYDFDRARVMIDAIVDKLLVTDDEITRRAAIWLLEAIGDVESLERVQILQDVDDRTGPLHRFPHQPSPLNPDEKTEEPADAPNGNDLWLFPMSASSEDLNFERLEGHFCRTNPGLIRDIFSQAADGASARSDEQLAGLAKQAGKIVILLSPNRRDTLASEFRRRSATMTESTLLQQDLLEATAILELWGLSTSEQWHKIKAEPSYTDILSAILPVISCATEGDVKEIASDLHDLSSSSMQVAAIRFLIKANASGAMKDWNTLQDLVSDDDQNVRLIAVHAAARSLNSAALAVFVESDWTVKPEQSTEEYAYCSLALNAASNLYGTPELLGRAHPGIWGLRILQGDESALAFENFNIFVRDQVLAIGRSGPFPVTQNAWDHSVALGKLVQTHSELVLNWLGPWLEEHDDVPNFLMIQSFPVLDLAKALLEHDLREGKLLWEKLMQAERDGFCKNADVKFMPLAGRAATDDEFTETILSELITDDKFRDFSYLAEKNGHGAWLANQIRRDILSPDVGKQARGWMLLGFSDASDASQALWHDMENARPKRGWLLGVYDLASKNYEQNRWTRHWHEQLMNARDDLSIYGAFTLFSKTVDIRVNLWRQTMASLATGSELRINAYWRLNEIHLNKASKDAQKGRKDRLFGLPTMRHTQSPWL